MSGPWDPRWRDTVLCAVVVLGLLAGVALTTAAADAGTATTGADIPDASGHDESAVPVVSTGHAPGGDALRSIRSADGDINVTITVRRTPADVGRARVTYTAEIPANVSVLAVSLDGSFAADYRVLNTTGFRYNDSIDAWANRSDRSRRRTASLTYAVATNTSGKFADPSTYDTVETAGWLFLGSQIDTRDAWRYVGAPPTYRRQYVVAGEGYAGEGPFAFAGPVRTVEGDVGPQSVTLVVPDAADPDFAPGATFDALAAAAGNFTVGDRDPRVTAYVLPPPIRRGGTANGGATFWVDDGYDLEIDSPLYHEYVHTRQAWTDRDTRLRPANDTEWFTEASAEYYGGYLPWVTGNAATQTFRAFVSTERNATAVLQDPDRESGERKDYTKGRRVLAALDIRIQQHTGGSASLVDVVRQVNALDGSETFDYAALRGEVVSLTNESVGTWLDTHVMTDAVPSIPPDVEAAYPAVDSAGLADENDRFEPNFDFGTATAIDSNASLSGLRVVRDESDVYAVNLTRGRVLTATVRFAHATGDLDLALYGPDGRRLAGNESVSDDETATIGATENGTYYVEVYGFGDAEAPYDLNVSTRRANVVFVEGTIARPNESTRATGDISSFRNGEFVRQDPLDPDGSFSVPVARGANTTLVYYDTVFGADGEVVEFTYPDGNPDFHVVAARTFEASTDLGEITLPRGHPVSVTVEDGSGNPVANASLDYRLRPDGGFFDVRTLPDGTPRTDWGEPFEIAGRVNITATGPPNGPLANATAATETTVTDPTAVTLTLSGASDGPDAPGENASRYENANGVVGTAGLRTALGEWASGDISTTRLIEVLTAWSRGSGLG